jgi:hypothetical protein
MVDSRADIDIISADEWESVTDTGLSSRGVTAHTAGRVLSTCSRTVTLDLSI